MKIPYPPVGFHFRVDFTLNPSATCDTRFQEVSGLSRELGVEEVSEGGENRFVHRLPGRAKYGNLILKRGLVPQSELIAWCRDAVENFIFAPALVTVFLLNESHTPLGDAFAFHRAWPVKWSVSDFKAQENAIVVETLELAYSYFTLGKK